MCIYIYIYIYIYTYSAAQMTFVCCLLVFFLEAFAFNVILTGQARSNKHTIYIYIYTHHMLPVLEFPGP